MADNDKLYKCTVDNEATYGVGDGAATPVPLTNDCVPEPDVEKETDPDLSSSLAEAGTQISNLKFRMPVKFYLKGTGAAGGTPEWAKLMKAFGLSMTVNAGTSVVFSPVNTGHPSVSNRVNVNGVDWLVTGFRGESLTIPFVAGKRVMVEGVGVGRYNKPATAAYSAPTFTDAAISAPRVASMGVTIDSKTHVIPEMRLVMENTIDPLGNINAGNFGIESVDIIARKWRLEFPNIIRDGNNDIEWWTLWENRTEFAVQSTGFGTVGGNRFQVDMSNVQIEDIKHVSVNGRVGYTVVCKILKGSTLANEFSMTND